MVAPLNQVFFPSGFQELFSSWSRFPDAVLYAGGVGIIREQGLRVPAFPNNIICLNKIEDLRKISRTERYLEIGAMVTLNRIIRIGKIVPEALILCIKQIADPQLRNQVTIGGNLCNPSGRLDCSTAMIALEAQFELRKAQSSRWIAASRFLSPSGLPVLESQEILSRIRIPLEPWGFNNYRKFRIPGSSEPGGGIFFIMRNQKNILTDIRVIYSGLAVLRDKNSEAQLLGKHLPLEKKDTKAFIDKWKTYLTALESAGQFILPQEFGTPDWELVKAQVMHFIERTILSISD